MSINLEPNNNSNELKQEGFPNERVDTGRDYSWARRQAMILEVRIASRAPEEGGEVAVAAAAECARKQAPRGGEQQPDKRGRGGRGKKELARAIDHSMGFRWNGWWRASGAVAPNAKVRKRNSFSKRDLGEG